MIENQINNQVDHIQVILDKRIPLKLLQIAEGENVIFCKKFEEDLFDSGVFSTREKDFVHKYVTENGQKYIITDVSTEEGKTYKDVKFKVIVSEKSDVPFCTFNPVQKQFIKEDFKISSVEKPQVNVQEEQTIEQKPIDISEALTNKKQDSKSLERAKILEKKIQDEKIKLLKEKQELEIEKKKINDEKIIFEKIEEYKQDLLIEFIDVSSKQKTFIEEQISENFKNVGSKLNEEIKSFHLNSEDVLKELNTKNLIQLKQDVNEGIKNQQKEIEKYLENIQVSSGKILIEKTEELKKLFQEKFVLDLQEHKNNLTKEILNLSNDNVQSFIANNKKIFNESIQNYFKEEKEKAEKNFKDGIESIKFVLEKTSEKLKEKTPELDERIRIIDEKIEQLSEERKKSDLLINEAKKYADNEIKKALEDSKNYAKRILDLGGGGGSVAVQYANGGTMNGDLNVNGNILSGGKNLSNYFGSGGGGTANLGEIPALSSSWNSVYSTTRTNSSFWSEAYTNLVNNSASYLSAVDLSLLATTSSSWNSVYSTTQTNSGLWSNWSTVSANYALGSQYVKLSGDTMTGGLTALSLSARDTVSTNSIQTNSFIANTGFVIADTGTSRIISASDNGKCITFSNTSPITASVPAGLPVGFNLLLIQINTGQVQLSAGPGVTINSDGGKTKIASQHSSASLISYASNIFNLAGNLTT